MAKIGRNAPCPCGSGRKYKKCCLDKHVEHYQRYQVTRTVQWDMDEIRSFSTEQIINKLAEFGVAFQEEQFMKDIKNYYSACDLAEHWEEIYPITAKGFDIDFIWMACIILWERLAPGVVNSEQLNEMMQKGYAELETEGPSKACVHWLEVWEQLKKRFTTEMKSIHDAEQVFSGLQSLFNWCQDFEMELGNAGLDDISFFDKQIKYCKEFCEFFPETDDLIIINMKRAEAESYFERGMIDQGEKAFEALIKQFPHSVWGYIGWGDMYVFDYNKNVPKNYEKAEQIYQMALRRNVDDKQVVIDRLKSLDEN